MCKCLILEIATCQKKRIYTWLVFVPLSPYHPHPIITMSAKTTIKRSSKKEKEAVKVDVDLEGIDILPDEKAKELQSESELIKSALLGYGKADILKLDLLFGTWNIREIRESEVSLLQESFKEGIQRYVTKNLIPIVLDKDDIDVSKLAKEPSAGGDVFPIIEFKRRVSPILAAGGQHRRAVILRLQESLLKDIAALEKGEEKGELTALKQKLKGIGYWGFAIYDKGK